MKKISLLTILATLLVTISSCDSGNRIDTEIFSVEAPTGYITDGDIPDFDGTSTVSFKNFDNASAINILAFPFTSNPEKMLHSQTFGGTNQALSDMTFTSDVEPFKYGSVAGYKVDMRGVIDGESLSGTAYSFLLEDATFIMFSFDADRNSTDTDSKVIESIRINKEFMDKMDSRAQVENVATLGRRNIPAMVDEITTWNDIEVNHDKKEVMLKMTLAGTADDYENVDQALEMMRPGMAANLKESRESDWLILVPTANGYSIGYNYVTADDNVTIATIRFTPEEIND